MLMHTVTLMTAIWGLLAMAIYAGMGWFCLGHCIDIQWSLPHVMSSDQFKTNAGEIYGSSFALMVVGWVFQLIAAPLFAFGASKVRPPTDATNSAPSLDPPAWV